MLHGGSSKPGCHRLEGACQGDVWSLLARWYHTAALEVMEELGADGGRGGGKGDKCGHEDEWEKLGGDGKLGKVGRKEVAWRSALLWRRSIIL